MIFTIAFDSERKLMILCGITDKIYLVDDIEGQHFAPAMQEQWLGG